MKRCRGSRGPYRMISHEIGGAGATLMVLSRRPTDGASARFIGLVMQIIDAMPKLSWIRRTARLLSIVAFALVTIEAKPLAMDSAARPATEGSCCARMAHTSPACPASSGMNGTSCCNMQICFQLFLQTRELRLEPGFAEFKWDAFDCRGETRADRPPVPPPRA